jgi:hypothetical protein
MTTVLNPKITQAGLALFPSATLPGFHVTLTHIGLGTGRYAPSGAEVALRSEVARFPITSGTNPSARTVQVGLTITDTDPQGRTANGRGIGEIGFYSGDTLFAVWSADAEPLFYKSQAFDVPMAYTLDVSALPASSVTVMVDPNKQGLETLILAHEAKDDPHPQYLTPTEGSTLYTPLSHASATDPHPQYLTPVEGGGLFAPLSHTTDTDPHPQYLTPAEGSAAYVPRSHLADADPHPQYLTPAEGSEAYLHRGHASEGNPHPQYMQRHQTNAEYVKQGGGAGQSGNFIYVGWTGSGVSVQVDQTPMGNIALESWVNSTINNLIGAAPSTLDQLGELARAIGSDPNFAVTMANQLAGKERRFDVGTRLACASYYAPTGWTTVNDDSTNNRMMRVVPSNGSETGGVHNPVYNDVVPWHTHGFTTGTVSSDHSHHVSDPGHTHGGGMMVGNFTYAGGNQYLEEGHDSPNYARSWMDAAASNITLGGISANHTHSGSTDGGSSQTAWQPRYLNLIIIYKNQQ